MTTDTIADMLTRIRNANLAKHQVVQIPSTKLTKNIAQVLFTEGLIDSFEELKNGLKFQDLHFEFSIGTEFSISDKFKLYFEPSVQHSTLFRKEDLINPNYMISFRLGLKLRSHKE